MIQTTSKLIKRSRNIDHGEHNSHNLKKFMKGTDSQDGWLLKLMEAKKSSTFYPGRAAGAPDITSG